MFSIIIPAYNSEKTIGYCLESVINQDFPKNEYEIIVIDDCSPDNQNSVIREIIDRYHHEWCNIRLIEHKENKRQGGARNTGIKAAKGEWIFFLDSDDYWCTTNVLTVFDSILRTYPQEHCDIIESYTHKDICHLQEKIEIKDISLDTSTISNITNTDFLLSEKYSGYVWRSCYKKSHITNVLFREHVYFEDGDWKLRALLKPGNVIAFDFPFYAYVNNPYSTIRKPTIEVFIANLSVNRINFALTEDMTNPALAAKLRNRVKRNVFSYIKISKNYPLMQSYRVFRHCDMRYLTNFNNFKLNFKERIILGAMRYCPFTLISFVKAAVLTRRTIRRAIRQIS